MFTILISAVIYLNLYKRKTVNIFVDTSTQLLMIAQQETEGNVPRFTKTKSQSSFIYQAVTDSNCIPSDIENSSPSSIFQNNLKA